MTPAIIHARRKLDEANQAVLRAELALEMAQPQAARARIDMLRRAVEEARKERGVWLKKLERLEAAK